jgi:hypothetical protein
VHCRFLRWIYPRVNQFFFSKQINFSNINISLESLLNLNWSDLSWFQHFNTELSDETALAYFCQVGNPFYDRSSLNEQISKKNLPAEAMVIYLLREKFH